MRLLLTVLVLLCTTIVSAQEDTLHVKVRERKSKKNHDIHVHYDMDWRPKLTVNIRPFDSKAVFDDEAVGPFAISGEAYYYLKEDAYLYANTYLLGFYDPFPSRTNVLISIKWSRSHEEITKYVPRALIYVVTAYTLCVVVIVS